MTSGFVYRVETCATKEQLKHLPFLFNVPRYFDNGVGLYDINWLSSIKLSKATDIFFNPIRLRS